MIEDLNRIHFTSYCWSLGTTSFRPKNFNYMIESQLILLKRFFEINGNKEKWQSNPNLQSKYYDFMIERKFIQGKAQRKDKDARQKTSGLVSLGLINDNRQLTQVGEKLVDILENEKFKENIDNFFSIDNDSYIYLLQLLKYTTPDNVKPFIVLIKILCELEYISEDEFKYILPLVINEQVAREVVNDIKKLRSGYITIDEIIKELIWGMDNYQAAFNYFIHNNPTIETFILINMNRKSGKKYEPPYAMLYKKMIEVYVEGKDSEIKNLFDAVNSLSGKARQYWKKLVFKKKNRNSLQNNGIYDINDLPLSKMKDEYSIKKYMFETIHLYKWRSTLDDYYDLNRRYMKLSDIVIFEDTKIYLSLLAKEYFKDIIDDLFTKSFKRSKDFDKIVQIEEILGGSIPKMDIVYTNIAAHFDEEYIDPKEIQNYINNERLKRFNRLIDNRFSDEILVKLLEYFEKRNDTELNNYITENADAPTMFEYILGIIWYKLSDRKGNILEFMNLRLDGELLPKSHACGGKADIVYQYDECNCYPKHNLLIEATLSDSSNQRRMEMEPVSRHLICDLNSTNNLNDYAILLATKIHPSIISDFRGKSKTEQTLDNMNFYDGIKILPLDTSILKKCLIKKINYKTIYENLDKANKSDILISKGWYEKEVLSKF